MAKAYDTLLSLERAEKKTQSRSDTVHRLFGPWNLSPTSSESNLGGPHSPTEPVLGFALQSPPELWLPDLPKASPLPSPLGNGGTSSFSSFLSVVVILVRPFDSGDLPGLVFSVLAAGMISVGWVLGLTEVAVDEVECLCPRKLRTMS
jgi:hypothetical protein